MELLKVSLFFSLLHILPEVTIKKKRIGCLKILLHILKAMREKDGRK